MQMTIMEKNHFLNCMIFWRSTHRRNRQIFCAAGFILKNTLSENGGVTRGVCQVNENGYLTGIDETKNIVKVGNKAAVQKEDGQEPIDENSMYR